MSVLTDLVIFSTLFYGVCAIPNGTFNSTDTMESWIKLDNTLKDAVQSAIKYLMPIILESSSKVNISSLCVKQTFQLITGLRSLKIWAFNFVDSSAKLTDGLLSGTQSSFGEYDQCLETVVPHPKTEEILFQGQYCVAEIRLPLPPKTKRYRSYDRLEELRNFNGTEVVKLLSTRAHLMYYVPIKRGFCIPSGCTKEDLKNILSYAVGKINGDAKVSNCEIAKKETSLRGVQIFAIFTICFLVSLVFIGTWMDVHSNSERKISKNICLQMLLSFSITSNFKRLMSTKGSMDKFRCIHGIRCFTIFWVIYGHVYLFPGMFVSNYRAVFRIPEMASSPVVQPIFNGSEAVDIFFFIGGLLVSYFTVQRIKMEKKNFNFLVFVLHRFCRIVPVVYFIILVGFLAPLMGSGPVFQELMKTNFNSCFDEWWRNVFFVNNFFYTEDLCLKHTWYVSCDVQLYLISIVVILPLIRSQKIGLILNSLIILLSMVFTGVMCYIHDLSPTIIFTHMNPDDQYVFFVYSYANVLSRAGPYFVGVFTGYILVTKPDIKISKKIQVVGWTLAVLSSGMVIFASAIWLNVHPLTFLETVMYSATYKVAFSAGVAWLTFCCVTGHGGFINTALSWKLWMPLSKLVFLIYLIQPMFHIIYIANFKSIQDVSHLQMAVQFFGFFGISMLLSLICNLLIESPFLNIQKIVLNSGNKRELKKKENSDRNCGDENGDAININGTLEMVKTENGVDNKCFTRC